MRASTTLFVNQLEMRVLSAPRRDGVAHRCECRVCKVCECVMCAAGSLITSVATIVEASSVGGGHMCECPSLPQFDLESDTGA